MEYAPAPESTAIVSVASRYGLFINGEFVEPKSGRWFTTINPATEEPLAEVAEAGTEDVDARRDGRRGAATRCLARSARQGAREVRVPYRAATAGAQRGEFAVLETMNGGKPIKESRDVDMPLAAAHFFYYAGWADKLEYAVPRTAARAARRGRADHPVELPAAHGGVEARARARHRQHVVLKPAETTPLTALLLAELCRRPASRPAW